MLECATCGAVGDEYFSENYFGELVCDLCGTQSFLQNRNETQDMEDTTMDVTKVAKLKKRGKRKRSRTKVETNDDKPKLQHATLLHCLEATQNILSYQAHALINIQDHQLFPKDFANVVEDLWFYFLSMWELKSSKPLLACYTQFFVHYAAEDRVIDSAITNQTLEEWNCEHIVSQNDYYSHDDTIASIPASPSQEILDTIFVSTLRTRSRKNQVIPSESQKNVNYHKFQAKVMTLNSFLVIDLVAILVISARILNLGLLPCDFAYWIACGNLPLHNVLKKCCSEGLMDAIQDISLFFDTRLSINKISTGAISLRTQYLAHQLELELPPLNVPLVGIRICQNLGLPSIVVRRFRWICANIASTQGKDSIPGMSEDDKKLEKLVSNPLPLENGLANSIGIAAQILIAIKLCPNWYTWIFEQVSEISDSKPAFGSGFGNCKGVPNYSKSSVEHLPRRELKDFLAFCNRALHREDRDVIPEGFQEHVRVLNSIYANSEENSGRNFIYREHNLFVFPVPFDISEEFENENILNATAKAQSHNGAEENNTYFFPTYRDTDSGRLHSYLEFLLVLLSEYIDAPVFAVWESVKAIDNVVRKRNMTSLN